MTRIIVADHHDHSLQALKTMLQETSDVVLVGEAANAKDLFKLAEVKAADVVVVDRHLPGSTVGNLLTSLHALETSPFVIVMGSQSEDSRMALNAGADAFVSKGDGPEWLLEYLRNFANRDHSLQKDRST